MRVIPGFGRGQGAGPALCEEAAASAPMLRCAMGSTPTRSGGALSGGRGLWGGGAGPGGR